MHVHKPIRVYGLGCMNKPIRVCVRVYGLWFRVKGLGFRFGIGCIG